METCFTTITSIFSALGGFCVGVVTMLAVFDRPYRRAVGRIDYGAQYGRDLEKALAADTERYIGTKASRPPTPNRREEEKPELNVENVLV